MDRAADGRFPKGVSGNPGGRTRTIDPAVREAAASASEAAIGVLVSLLDTGTPASRLHAARELLRAGRAPRAEPGPGQAPPAWWFCCGPSAIAGRLSRADMLRVWGWVEADARDRLAEAATEPYSAWPGHLARCEADLARVVDRRAWALARPWPERPDAIPTDAELALLPGRYARGPLLAVVHLIVHDVANRAPASAPA